MQKSNSAQPKSQTLFNQWLKMTKCSFSNNYAGVLRNFIISLPPATLPSKCSHK